MNVLSTIVGFSDQAQNEVYAIKANISQRAAHYENRMQNEIGSAMER